MPDLDVVVLEFTRIDGDTTDNNATDHQLLPFHQSKLSHCYGV